MKSFSIIAFLLTITVAANAQEDAIKRYFNKYSSDERFTSVYVSNKMFSMFSNLDDESNNTAEDKEIKEMLSKLGGLRVLSSDATDGRKMYLEANQLLVTKGFEDLMVVREKGKSEFKFLIREVNGKVRELLMLSGANKNFFLMSIIGDIDLKKISKLSKGLDVDGMENLENLKDKRTN